VGRCLWRSATNRRVIRLQPYRCRRSYLNSQPHPLKQNTPKETTSAQGSASVKLSAECGWNGGAEADLAERKKMEKITQWWGMVSTPFARNGTRVLHGAGQMQPFRTPAGRIRRESLFYVYSLTCAVVLPMRILGVRVTDGALQSMRWTPTPGLEQLESDRPLGYQSAPECSDRVEKNWQPLYPVQPG